MGRYDCGLVGGRGSKHMGEVIVVDVVSEWVRGWVVGRRCVLSGAFLGKPHTAPRGYMVY